MKPLIVGSPEAMSKEPCLEHPDYLPLPKPKKSGKDMEIPPERRLFSGCSFRTGREARAKRRGT